MDIKQRLSDIQESQRTIDSLLEAGEFSLLGRDPINKWVLEPFHQGKTCSVGFVHIKDINYGPCEEHLHPDSKEYLIVVTGSIMLNVNGQDVRKLEVGDCGVIRAGDLHHSRPLEHNTKLVYICVPADKGMESLLAKYRRPDV